MKPHMLEEVLTARDCHDGEPVRQEAAGKVSQVLDISLTDVFIH